VLLAYLFFCCRSNWSHVSACGIDQPLVHEELDSEEECYDEEEDSNGEEGAGPGIVKGHSRGSTGSVDVF